MAVTGARLNGAVLHVIKNGMSHDVSACGRVVIAGKGEGMRMCRTCVRVNEDARRIDDKRRKTSRDARMAASITGEEIQTEFISWEFDLTAFELAMTEEKIAKINARCEKRGIPGGLNVESHEETRKETNIFGVTTEWIVFATRITGIAPKLPNWEFVATLDYDQHAGLIVRTYPGVNSIDRSELREGFCDHCQTDRYRKSTYVMRNTKTGEQVQVGSSCIKDFTGWTALPYTFDRMASDVEEFSGGFGGGARDVTTLTVLGIAWACVTEYGYVKSRDMNSTVGYVRDVLNPPKKISSEDLAELRRLAVHGESMEGKAKELQAWILSDEFSGNSEYVLNLKSIIGAKMVSPRNMGILCSAPQAWAKHLEKTFINKVEKSENVSAHVGEIGERWELLLKVESERYIETAYGSSTLYRMSDASGNVFKWFASNDILSDYIGEYVSIAAGIKAHNEWKGVDETSLTRCKVIGDIEIPRKIKDATVKATFEIKVSDAVINMNEVYLMNGEYFRIRTTKGIAYAVRHTADGWTYAQGSIRQLERMGTVLTADDAARFGHEHKRCVYCHKNLTDARSMGVGYGSDCASAHGLPWGE
jgi:hypothetical protein